jgi:hypothetical protein
MLLRCGRWPMYQLPGGLSGLGLPDASHVWLHAAISPFSMDEFFRLQVYS